MREYKISINTFKNINKSNFGWFLVLILALLPVVLWLLSPALTPRFSSFSVGMSNMGQILGLVGAAMFAINLMLSTRLHFIEKLFFGLNRVYYRHSHLGQIAFMLLLFHSLLLIPKYSGGSFYRAALFLLPSNNLAINFGWFALVGMILLIVITLFVPIKYNFWKVTHKFFGLFFFLASLHIWLIPSDVARFLPLRIYMVGISLIGLCAYIYYSLLGKLFVKKLRFVVKAVNPLGDSVVNIIMEPVEKKLQFNPGQFVFVSFKGKWISRESHPFSITSSPDDENISITTKKLGDYTNNLNNLLIGTEVFVEGPYGFFSHTNTKNNKQIWIAGGIGITPFISMAKSLKPSDNYNIELYYCLKNESEAVYLDELQKISMNLQGEFKIIPHYSDLKGFISADVIEKESSNQLKNKDIFICAPPKMISSLKLQFLTKGISKKLIFSEEFSF
jgi:predicted ferric reductase